MTVFERVLSVASGVAALIELALALRGWPEAPAWLSLNFAQMSVASRVLAVLVLQTTISYAYGFVLKLFVQRLDPALRVLLAFMIGIPLTWLTYFNLIEILMGRLSDAESVLGLLFLAASAWVWSALVSAIHWLGEGDFGNASFLSAALLALPFVAIWIGYAANVAP